MTERFAGDPSLRFATFGMTPSLRESEGVLAAKPPPKPIAWGVKNTLFA